MTNIDLSNKQILLTGASDGIGKGMADYLMKMGARVAVHYNTHKDSAESLVIILQIRKSLRQIYQKKRKFLNYLRT